MNVSSYNHIKYLAVEYLSVHTKDQSTIVLLSLRFLDVLICSKQESCSRMRVKYNFGSKEALSIIILEESNFAMVNQHNKPIFLGYYYKTASLIDYMASHSIQLSAVSTISNQYCCFSNVGKICPFFSTIAAITNELESSATLSLFSTLFMSCLQCHHQFTVFLTTTTSFSTCSTEKKKCMNMD